MSSGKSYFILSSSLYQINYTRRQLLLSLIDNCNYLSIVTLAVVYKHGDMPINSPYISYVMYKNLLVLYFRTFLSLITQGRSKSTIISFSPLMNIFGFFMSFLGYKHTAIISGLGRFGFIPGRYLFKFFLSIGFRSKLILMNKHDLSFVRSLNKPISYKLIPSEGISDSILKHVDCTKKSNRPQILFIARLLRSKGIFSFLAFFHAVNELCFDFVVIGEGSVRIERYLERLQVVHQNFIYYKRVSEDQKFYILNQSTHFFYQSNYFEGAPLTLLEAQVFNLVPIYLDSRIGHDLLYESYSSHNLSLLEPHSIVSYILETMPRSTDSNRCEYLSDIISREHGRNMISSQMSSFILKDE